MVEIHILCILSITDKSMVTPGQAPKFIFPTPKIHFSYNKRCFGKFDNSVACLRKNMDHWYLPKPSFPGMQCVHMVGGLAGDGQSWVWIGGL